MPLQASADRTAVAELGECRDAVSLRPDTDSTLVPIVRTGAYFSVAPLFGVIISFALWPEMPQPQFWAAAALMGFGVWLHVRERHEHEHTHEPLEHAHRHVHDEHHQHEHDFPWDGTEPHLHAHRHEVLTHKHPHWVAGYDVLSPSAFG